ncbi:hypothetical protein BJV77DRAFT_1065263 [Russula vinacea]|nr:hypothetical protein BJV77DRAFT_1065263 [Russula vinacea]
MSSTPRSIVCYTDSAEFSSSSMTLLSRVPGYRSDFSTKSTPSRSATSRQPQADPVLPSVTATFASAQAQAISSAQNSSPLRNQLVIQLASFLKSV